MSLQMTATDRETGKQFRGELHQVPENSQSAVDSLPEEMSVSSLFPEIDYLLLMHGQADASRYIERAIRLSWHWVTNQYRAWQPEEGVNYPIFHKSKTAWGASSAAVGIPVVLPAATLRVDRPIELPQCIPLLGSGAGKLLGGSKIRFTKSGCFKVIGNVALNETDPFQMISGGIAGVKFARGENSPIALLGNLSNFRISNCHFSGVGQRKNPMINHVNAYEQKTMYGKILTSKNSGHTLKEVTIEDCQFEGGLSAFDLTGGLNINIHNNTILYSHIGMVFRNCKKVRVTCNNVNGTKAGEPIQVNGQAGLVAGGSDFSVSSNQFRDLDIGCVINSGKGAMNSNNLFLNDWQRVKAHQNGTKARVPATWKFPRDFGSFKKGTRAPFAG